MERATTWFVAITALIIGASHILRPNAWADAFGRLHRLGRPGAFINGGLSLLPGALIVATIGNASPQAAVIFAFGGLLVTKSLVCFLWPDTALKSMALGSEDPFRFQLAGLACFSLGVWATYYAVGGG